VLEPVDAGLALAPNGLRALDVAGAGDRVRALVIPHHAITRWSARPTIMTTWTSPAATTLRDTLTWTLGKLAPQVPLGSLARIYDWQPPPAPARHPAIGADPGARL
jgi:2-polyprenyl-6-methoxyphenol hydroxylase-like FAD-dependent oxidoreductase